MMRIKKATGTKALLLVNGKCPFHNLILGKTFLILRGLFCIVKINSKRMLIYGIILISC